MEQNYCSNCGTQLDDTTAFCSQCGTPVSNSKPINEESAPVQEPTPIYEQVTDAMQNTTEDSSELESIPPSEPAYNQYSYTGNASDYERNDAQQQDTYTAPNYSQEQGYSTDQPYSNPGMNNNSYNNMGSNDSKAMAIASMVLGIVGLLLSCVVVGGLFGIIGLVLGIIVLVKRKPGKPFAIAAVVTSAISILSAIYFLFVLVVFTSLDSSDIYNDSYDFWNDDYTYDSDYDEDWDSDYSSESSASSPGTNKDGTYTEGVYLVGTDLEAGEYLLNAEDSDYGGYLELATDTSDTIDSIITNENFDNRCYITVSDGQYFKFERCTATLSANSSPYEAKEGRYPAGMYKVGVDIPAGTYTVVPQEDTYTGSGSYIIYSKSTCDYDDVMEIENIKSETEITLAEGTYLFLSYAYIQA